jgi:hypothetical protein
MTALAPLAVVLTPMLTLILMFALAARARRAREDALVRQVAVTDAIHRELGAIVAPFVTATREGGWQALIAVPFERPAVVERVVVIARETLARLDPARADQIRIVLIPQERLTKYIPAATSTMVRASALVTASPRKSAPASMPKIGVQKEKAASGAAG